MANHFRGKQRGGNLGIIFQNVCQIVCFFGEIKIKVVCCPLILKPHYNNSLPLLRKSEIKSIEHFPMQMIPKSHEG